MTRAKKSIDALNERKSLEQAIETALTGASPRINSALRGEALRDDLVLPAEKKDDAIYHAVNHAHQRDPRKKWS
ncbi:hypothetical protein O3W44_00205 [Pantoea sp. LMR881]|uniref:hypothetical protein n=1 Tax=Pantoea sp. LMR881 TaxID=3014336 RepID=UPI0022B0008F|nr:hypothetical protein [Pantoea sp. LMR881]MCZ4057826.1 hypothetical protein [Pantoea sp. LMR881]